MKNLSGRTEGIMRALVAILQPRSEKLDLDLSQEMLDFSDEFLGHLPAPLRLAFPLGLYLVEFGGPIFGGGFARFSKMDRQAQERYVAGWGASRLGIRRELIKGVKSIALAGYFSNPEALSRIGYDPDAWVEEARALRKKLMEKYGA